MTATANGRVTYQDALRHLGVIDDGADKHTLRCPYHDDSDPSLLVSRKGDDDYLAHCRAGCTDVWTRIRDEIRATRPPEERKPDRRHPYETAEGELIATKVIRHAARPGKKPRKLIEWYAPDGRPLLVALRDLDGQQALALR